MKLGGSRVQIAGPTAAFATIVAGIIAKKGMDGLVIATVIAGIILILMGVFRLGGLIKYMHSMEELHKRCEEKGVKLVFSHVNEQPYKTMEKSGFIEKVGKDNFRPHIDDALEWASKLSESVKSEV